MNLRLWLAGAAIVLAAAAPGWAAEPVAAPTAQEPDLLHALAGCAKVTESQARLACYDMLAPRVQAAIAAPAVAPAQVAGAHPPTKEEQKSWFGFDMGDLFGTSPKQQTTPQQFGSETTAAAQTKREENRPKQINSITAKLTDYAFNPFGKFVVFLDNGQVWKQMQGDSGHAHFRRKASDNTVTISRGFLGSYNMTINGHYDLYKVTRMK